MSLWFIPESLGVKLFFFQSNQRVMFDLDPWGRYLATGTQTGDVLFFDTTTFELVHTLQSGGGVGGETISSGVSRSDRVVESEKRIEMDGFGQGFEVTPSKCMNTVQFHPYCGLLMGVVGERVFAPCLDDDDDDEDDEVEVEGEEEGNSSGRKRKRASTNSSEVHSEILLWSLDKEQLKYPDPAPDITTPN